MALLLLLAGLSAFVSGWTVLAFLEPRDGKGFAAVFKFLSKDDPVPVGFPFEARVEAGFQSLTGLPLFPTSVLTLVVSIGAIVLVMRARSRAQEPRRRDALSVEHPVGG